MNENNLAEMIVHRIRDYSGSRYLFNNRLLELFSAASFGGLPNKGAIVRIQLNDANIDKTVVSYGPEL